MDVDDAKEGGTEAESTLAGAEMNLLDPGRLDGAEMNLLVPGRLRGGDGGLDTDGVVSPDIVPSCSVLAVIRVDPIVEGTVD